jgi:large subunit ribosomal protein L35
MAKKNKTKKAILKRVKLTGKGKVKYRRPGKSHLQSGKSGNRRRGLRRSEVMKKCDAKRTLALMR